MKAGRKIAVVTGGAGFIGSHMVDLLAARGYVVRIIDNLAGGREANIAHHGNNADVVFKRSDIRDCEPGDAVFENADYVFHFAGIGDIVPSIERPIEYMSVNAQGTVRVLECARQAGVNKFVYAASSSCYGIAATPTREDHPITPQYPYALSKYQGEQAAFHWHKVYQLPVNSVRIFNAYGTRSRTIRRLWRSFRGLPQAEACRQAIHRRRRRQADPRFPLCDGRGVSVPGCGRDHKDWRDMESRRRQSAIGQSPGRAPRRARRPYPEASRRAGLHLGRHRQDQPRPSVDAQSQLRGRRAAHA